MSKRSIPDSLVVRSAFVADHVRTSDTESKDLEVSAVNDMGDKEVTFIQLTWRTMWSRRSALAQNRWSNRIFLSMRGEQALA